MAFIDVIFDPGGRFEGELYRYADLIESANYATAPRVRAGLQEVILATYETALAEAGPGFPAIYAEHLYEGISSNLQPFVAVTGSQLIAQVFDITALGTYNDLEEGFHRHALEDPLQPDGTKFSLTVNVVDLPYVGQGLYNADDPEARYEFWQAVVDGTDYTVKTKENGGYAFSVPTAGLYEETLRDRISVWGNRYPEWLILEYGSDTYPQVPPTHISYFIQQNCLEFMETVWESEFNAILDAWNTQSIPVEIPQGAIYDPSGRGSKLRSSSTGRFVKKGG